MKASKSVLDYETAEGFLKAVRAGEFPVDLKGHYRGSFEYLFDCPSFGLNTFFMSDKLFNIMTKGMPKGLSKNELRERMLKGWKNKTIPYVADTYTCPDCGQRVRLDLVRGKKIVSSTKCEYPKGFPEIEARLLVPSGEIVLFNDLRHFYDEPSPHIDVNSEAGKKAYTDFYANQGMITHFLGNTSPGVWQPNKKTIIIGDLTRKMGKKQIGSICTDLWWYCAADREMFEKRAGKTVEQLQKEYQDRGCWPKYIIAKVVPGVYMTTGRYHLCGDERNSVFSTIKYM